ncbi:hypothetical protein [Yinghuangia soli]|uniref:Uncharacterized protein n=1 Tax=Yinghuangia soli TaxID=2908204 RepID=A0AA41Q197_9ACTN|nr:hypothetical protein [Yinghuangia soli]MCF2528222.1 hypothetical protein [Yinghuangia soli]
MSSYVVPALIAAACAAGVTAVARRAGRRAGERRAAELWDEEFMTALFHPESAPAGAAADGAFTEIAAELRAEIHEQRVADAAEMAGETTGTTTAAADGGTELPAARIPEQDPAMAKLPSAPEVAMPPLRSTTPHPSQGLAPMLPAHLTGAHLLGVAARGTAVTGLRSGTAGGLDVFDFADGGSMVVMPADPEVAALVAVALEQGQEVRLLGTSEVGGGRSLTFLVHESTAYFLADRVYARPAASDRT